MGKDMGYSLGEGGHSHHEGPGAARRSSCRGTEGGGPGGGPSGVASSDPRRRRRALDGPGAGAHAPRLVPPGPGTEGFPSAARPRGPLASTQSPEGHSKEASGLHPSTAAVPPGQGRRAPPLGWLAGVWQWS